MPQKLLPEHPGTFHECPLCDVLAQRIGGPDLNRADVHHLIPKSEHIRVIKAGKFTAKQCDHNLVILCRLCHDAIHQFFTNRQLADYLFTTRALSKVLGAIGWKA